MQFTIQLLSESIAEDVCEKAPRLYEESLGWRPPSIDDFGENMFFLIIENLDVHYVQFGLPEPEDIISRETLEENFIFKSVHEWFQKQRVASLEFPARGGGFSCLT